MQTCEPGRHQTAVCFGKCLKVTVKLNGIESGAALFNAMIIYTVEFFQQLQDFGGMTPGPSPAPGVSVRRRSYSVQESALRKATAAGYFPY